MRKPKSAPLMRGDATRRWATDLHLKSQSPGFSLDFTICKIYDPSLPKSQISHL